MSAVLPYELITHIINYMTPVQRLKARSVNTLFRKLSLPYVSIKLLYELNVEVYHLNKHVWFEQCNQDDDIFGLLDESNNVFTWKHGRDIPSYLFSKTNQVCTNIQTPILLYYGMAHIYTTKEKIILTRCSTRQALDLYIRIQFDDFNSDQTFQLT
jgi:hypothetical protein